MPPCNFSNEGSEIQIIFGYEQDSIAGLNLAAIVGCGSDNCLSNWILRDCRDARISRRQNGLHLTGYHRLKRAGGNRRSGPNANWQIKGKGAALAYHAREGHLTPEEPRNFAAYCQTQPGASVPAAGRTICLLKSLEYNRMLLGRNSNPGIGNT